MARRSGGGVLGLIIGALVLIAMIPREIGILLSILLAIAVVIFIVVKMLGAKANATPSPMSPPVREPTLAELMALRPAPTRRAAPATTPPVTDAWQSVTVDSSPAPGGQGLKAHSHPETVLPATPGPPAAGSMRPDRIDPVEARLHAQDPEWRRAREVGIEERRTHAQALRAKFAQDTNLPTSPPFPAAVPATTPTATAHAPHPLLKERFFASTSAPPAADSMRPERLDPMEARLHAQDPEWRRAREAGIEERRAHAQALRAKFAEATNPPTSPPPPAAVPTPTPTATARATHPLSKERLFASAPPPPASGLTHLGRLDATDARLHAQDSEWRRAREAGIEERRAHAQALRAKFAQATNPPTSPPSPAAVPTPTATAHAPHPLPKERFFAPTPPASAPSAQAHAIPAPPDGYGDGRWVPAGEAMTISGVPIPGGLLYVGARLPAANGLVDPCLVNAHLPIGLVGDPRNGGMGYWPSFATITPTQRRAYLNWLSQGASDPACDIGYVFLYFYGLERRIILDTSRDETVKAEWPAIEREVRRLLAIYGGSSNSFRRYASELLNWLGLHGLSTKLYNEPLPAFPPSYELPFPLRYALGQAALDRAPLPARLALAWLRHAAGVYLRTPATRCAEEFAALFSERYSQTFGAGLVLPKNKTKLKAQYRPASSGFSGATVSLTFGNVPDVAAMTAPIKKLHEFADRCTDELGSYSRLLGKDPGAKGSLEAALLLPASLWPESTRKRLDALAQQAATGPLTFSLDGLAGALGAAQQPLTRDRLRSVASALDGMGLGIEPHILGGARTPAGRDAVVVFQKTAPEEHYTVTAAYQTAVLTLQLAAACACADGQFHELEIAHLQREIEGWKHLAAFERERLRAHLQYLVAAPPTLAGLRSRLGPLSQDAKEILATLMATLVQSDGAVVPEEVKFLEKAYRVLGVETARVFSDVHAAGSGTPARTPKAGTKAFRLDRERIAALQRDTEQVSALLSKIFTEEPVPDARSETEPEPTASMSGAASWPLILDESHTALARLLLSRSQWSRADLEDAAADLDLMLDGALEQINEAAFDVFDAPLCEGDETVDVNIELLEKLNA